MRSLWALFGLFLGRILFNFLTLSSVLKEMEQRMNNLKNLVEKPLVEE